MLVNRAIEATRRLRLSSLLLARRARAAEGRVPVVLVPSVLGTRLTGLWDTTRQLYLRARARTIRTRGLLEQFTVVPALWSYDVYGGLVRFLEQVGGYRRDEELFVLDYDWRTGIADAAARLDELVQRIRGFGDQKLDLVGVSTGGLVVRQYLAAGGPEAAGATRRVVHVGTPQRGSLHVLEMLVQGVRPAPLGRRFSGTEIAQLQTAWDALPHPAEPVFVDERGRPLELDLYDPRLWLKLGLSELGCAELSARLQAARRLHEALAAAPGHADSFVIGGRHLPTAVRARVVRGRVVFAPCEPRRDDPHVGCLYAPGDSSVPESSLRALPGLDPSRLWWVAPSAHHLLPADPEVHRLVLEALLATTRPIRLTPLRVHA